MEDIVKLRGTMIPEILSEIPQPPKQLYIRGKLPDANFIYLCVVGSRNCTSYGKDVCQKLIYGLAGYPIVIVSGLALGIDTIAHKAALNARLITMAFPGSGLDNSSLHPKRNITLAQQIVDAGGCLVSEMEPDFKATPYSFPARNRLMAGMSKAVLIIEAEEKSGTLITARMALDYNRDVLAVPGSIYSSCSQGTNKLIQRGAVPITTSKDILEALGFSIENKPEAGKEKYADCSEEELRVIATLKEPLERDELIRQLEMETKTANALLSMMEIKGIITEEIGEVYLL